MSAAPTQTDKRNFWRRAEAARAARLISYGAFSYLGTLARLARARGDGQSFVLGERVIEDVTATVRRSAQRWRYQLIQAGLIAFDRRWAHKRGWFWEARTTLLFCPSTGVKMSPVDTGDILTPESGDKKTPSLNGRVGQQTGTGGRSGSSLRSSERRAAKPRPHAGPTGAATGGGEAPSVEQGIPTPPGGDGAGRHDVKGAAGTATPGADPGRVVPWDEAARRIRELAQRVRYRPTGQEEGVA